MTTASGVAGREGRQKEMENNRNLGKKRKEGRNDRSQQIIKSGMGRGCLVPGTACVKTGHP